MPLSRLFLVTALTCAVISCPRVAKTIANKGTSETASNVATLQKVVGVPAKKEAQTNTSEVTDERAIDIRGDHLHESENRSFPLWSVEHDDGGCSCGSHLDGIVTCTEDAKTVLIHDCYCMTYNADGNGPFVGRCFYSCFQPHRIADGTSDLIPIPRNISMSDLNDMFCGHWKRRGVLCGDCINGYAPQVYSFDLKCTQCNPADVYINVVKYSAAAFLGPTIFLLAILLFRIKITSGKLNAFIFVSQCISSHQVVRTVLYGMEHSYYSNSQYFLVPVKVIFSFYGLWNLDFFRPLLPVICFSTLNTRQAFSLDYIIAIYPLALLTILYVLIHLHEKNYRVVVFLWKPFHVCFARCRQIWEIRNSVIDTFAAFVLLSYFKSLNTLFNTFTPTQLYDASGTSDGSLYMYFDASISIFDKKHVVFLIMGLILFFGFNILPIILLCLYPTKCGRRCLRRGIGGITLQTFSDIFQGYYKDGTNGEPDRRFFPVVYLVTRMVLYAIYCATLTGYTLPVMATYLMATAVLVVVLQPYKDQFAKYNNIDVAMILLLAMFYLSLQAIELAHQKQLTHWYVISAVVIAAVLSLLPLLYAAFLLVRWILQHRRCAHRTYEVLIDRNE